MNFFRKVGKPKEEVKDILVMEKPDRRLLAHVPDPENIRKVNDRRGIEAEEVNDNSLLSRFDGQRYMVEFDVRVRSMDDKTLKVKGKCIDISQTGMLISFADEDMTKLHLKSPYQLKFSIPPGMLYEGMEKDFTISSVMVRSVAENHAAGFSFSEPLYRYLQKHQDRNLYRVSTLFLVFVTLFIISLRFESVIYFRFNSFLYFYSIMAALFLLSRYLFGALYKPMPIDPTYEPGVTILIPCFNEEEWIGKTILHCIDQDYPIDKLEVIVIDDCSNDNSYNVIQETLDRLYGEAERFKTKERVKFIPLQENKGKRHALAEGVYAAKHPFITFVDSDSFLEPDAIRNLVQPFVDPQIAGVAGRTDVANTYTNGITKMQSVRYFISYRVMKAAEAYFDSVMCLSGPISCYRRSVLEENLDPWLNQTFFEQPATFGDDRGMTNLIVKNHRTSYQDTAICYTIVPKDQSVFLKQQMRWKRSWLRETIIAAKFMWRKEPFMAIFFYIGMIIPAIAPIVVLYNLVYVPLTMHIFPLTFITGILMMALMMSFVQLLLRRSSIWLYGLWFCLYYEAILLWQMPWAWVTFWVSNWGTRMTPTDLEAKQEKESHRKWFGLFSGS